MDAAIPPLTDDRVPAASRPLLDQAKKALGMVPNLHRALAHAPAALRAYSDGARALAGGRLAPKLREQIALAAAGINRCSYCASAHTALGKGVGLDARELVENLSGRSSDPRAAVALQLVRELLERRGDVPAATLERVRAAGFSEEEIVEMVAHVGLNVFTNTFNVLAKTPVDFPLVEVREAACADSPPQW